MERNPLSDYASFFSELDPTPSSGDVIVLNEGIDTEVSPFFYQDTVFDGIGSSEGLLTNDVIERLRIEDRGSFSFRIASTLVVSRRGYAVGADRKKSWSNDVVTRLQSVFTFTTNFDGRPIHMSQSDTTIFTPPADSFILRSPDVPRFSALLGSISTDRRGNFPALGSLDSQIIENPTIPQALLIIREANQVQIRRLGMEGRSDSRIYFLLEGEETQTFPIFPTS